MERLPKPEHWQSKAAIGLGIAAIAAYEYFCNDDEFITDQVDRWRDSSKFGKLAVHAVVWTTAGHLTGVIPERWDWLHQTTRLKRQVAAPGR